MPVRNLTYIETLKLLEKVVDKEGLKIGKEIRDDIVDNCQGSARMALVLLDKIMNLEPEDMEKALELKISEENEGIDLCRALIKKESWSKVSGIIKNLKAEPESIRYMVLGYAKAVLLKSKNYQAWWVIDIFKEPFFYSKQAGLVHACYECLFSK